VPKTSSSSAADARSAFLATPPPQILEHSALQPLSLPAFVQQGLDVQLLRLDQVDPFISGNKYFKLYESIRDYLQARIDQPVASFGGAWSNHLHALAALGQRLGVPTVGVIRGDPDVNNPTLRDLRAAGMRLHFVSRADYRRRYETDYLAELESELGACYWIPEGGNSREGASGCMAIGAFLRRFHADVVAMPCGTGTTLAGVIAGLGRKSVGEVLGFSALKGIEQDLSTNIETQLEALAVSAVPSWRIIGAYHCGGFAKYPSFLANFVEEFESLTRVLLDPVYTAKLLYGTVQMAMEGIWSPGTRVIAVHTGGLQGRRGQVSLSSQERV